MFTIWFTEGGNRLCERKCPIVPRVGETVTLPELTGLFPTPSQGWWCTLVYDLPVPSRN